MNEYKDLENLYCRIILDIEDDEITIEKVRLYKSISNARDNLRGTIKDARALIFQLKETLNNVNEMDENDGVNQMLYKINSLVTEMFNLCLYIETLSKAECRHHQKASNKSLNMIKERFGNDGTITIKCNDLKEFIEYKNELQDILGNLIFKEKCEVPGWKERFNHTCIAIQDKCSNKNYMTALFITILSKQVKEPYIAGGYDVDIRLDDYDVDKLCDLLKMRLGVKDGSEIISKALEYSKKDHVKLMIDFSQDKIDSSSVEQIIRDYAYLCNYIK